MSAQGPYKITEEFEEIVARYTGAPFAIAVDCMSNALFMALTYYKMNNLSSGAGMDIISIPSHTYPSVPCEIMHAGFKVRFISQDHDTLTGPYQLQNTNIWDYALRFTSGMYVAGTTQCLSFTGPKKALKLGKGGMILTDDPKAQQWYKKARFSGRDECSYLDDDFDKDAIIGWNFYMMPEVATRGLLLMSDFPEHNKDLTIKYPDLSRFRCFQT